MTWKGLKDGKGKRSKRREEMRSKRGARAIKERKREK